MAKYYINNKIYNNENEVRKSYPNMSINFNYLPDGGVAILPTPKPAPTTNLKVVVPNGVTTDALGNTVEAWTERDMFTADILDEDGITVLKTIAEQENDYIASLEAKALEEKIRTATQAVDALIQAEIDLYNTTNGVAFKDIDALAKYVTVTTYPHNAFCVSMINWVAELWEAARTSTATNEADFLAGLPTRV